MTKSQEYYIKNREHILEKSKMRYEENKNKGVNKPKSKGIRIQKYWPDLTPEQAESEYMKLYYKQNGDCAICKRHRSEFKLDLAVDHNHFTGEVRGLLCAKCNKGLGLFKDNLDLLNSAKRYLKKCGI
jgi:hypothetical protein